MQRSFNTDSTENDEQFCITEIGQRVSITITRHTQTFCVVYVNDWNCVLRMQLAAINCQFGAILLIPLHANHNRPPKKQLTTDHTRAFIIISIIYIETCNFCGDQPEE